MSKATTVSVKPASSKPTTKIPQSALKAVSSLREIVDNTEEEIYAALKECHMDLNEAVQKLISQDPWEVPQRRKGKNKKESHGGQASGDSRVRSVPGAGSRGNRGGSVDRGSGRGGPKFNSTDLGGARGKPLPPRENGIHPSSRVVGNAPPQSQSAPFIQPKPYSQSQSPPAATTAASGAVPTSLSPSLPNGGAVYGHAPTPSASARPRGSWGPSGGGISMADIVKANGAPAAATPAPSPAASAATAAAVPAPPPAVQSAQSSSPSQYLSPSDSVSVSQTASSGVYASATDPVLHHPLEPRGASGAPMKRDLGTVGGQRPIGDRPTSATPAAPSSSGNVAPPSSQSAGPAHSLTPATSQVSTSSSGLEWKPKAPSQSQAAGVASSTTTSTSAVTMGDTGLPSSSAVNSKMQGLSLQEDNSKPVMIPSHLQVSESERPHLSFGSFEAATFSSFGPGFGTAVGETSASASSKGDAPSTVDTKLDAPAARQQSIGTSAAAPSSTQGYTPSSMSGSAAPTASSAAEGASISQNMTGTAALHLEPATSKADSSIMQQGPPYPYVPTLQSYPYGLVQQIPAGGQYGAPYEPTDVTQQQEVSSRLPGLGGMLYSDPSGSYYSPGFRPQPDSDASRYSPAGVSNTVMASAGSAGSGSSKYGGGAATTAPGVSQSGMGGETGVSSLSSSSLSAAGLSAAQTAATTPQGSHTPSSQQATASNVNAVGQSGMPTMPQQQQQQQQQPLPLHAGYATQPAGIPIGPYHAAGMYSGFAQYMPSTYTYHMHAPYGTHPTTYGVTPQNSAYPQAPAGTAYHPAAAGSSYPPGGGAANVKYPLPQYNKPGVGTGGAGAGAGGAGGPHHASTMASAGGYAAAGYAGGPSTGYVGAPSVSGAGGGTGMAGSGYEDVVGASQHYKDSNLYIASQQMTRDMAAGMPTSSYYNMAGQGQHAGYGHTQQPTHAHAAAAYAAAGLFHPSQAGPGPAGHQMLQQPQPMGGASGAMGVAQGGGYQQQQQQQQQQQRGQQSWNNGY